MLIHLTSWFLTLLLLFTPCSYISHANFWHCFYNCLHHVHTSHMLISDITSFVHTIFIHLTRYFLTLLLKLFTPCSYISHADFWHFFYCLRHAHTSHTLISDITSIVHTLLVYLTRWFLRLLLFFTPMLIHLTRLQQPNKCNCQQLFRDGDSSIRISTIFIPYKNYKTSDQKQLQFTTRE